MSSYDVAVLGGGPGGYAAALRAAYHGLSVALIEKGEIGGACLNRGCVPAKIWISAAETVDHARLMASLAAEPFEYSVDFPKMAARQRKIVAQFRKSLATMIEKRGIDVIEGEGRFIAADKIAVSGATGESEVSFKNAIIATGTAPASFFEGDPEVMLTNSSIFDLEKLPESILIIGAGPIGCEIAGVMARLGSEVTMVEMMPRVLPREDGEVSALLARELKKLKVRVMTGVKIDCFQTENGRAIATLLDGEVIEAEKALVSIGRTFPTGPLGLGNAGVKTADNGAIETDNNMRTSAPGIYAVGDVAGKNLLAYTAYREGALAADQCAGVAVEADEPVIPTAIFTMPEVGSVGVTQEEAPEDARVGTFMFRALARAHASGEISGFVKIIADADSDRLLGAHIVGPRATDMIHICSAALSAGMTARRLGAMLFAHPTFAEAIVEAAHDVHGQSIHK